MIPGEIPPIPPGILPLIQGEIPPILPWIPGGIPPILPWVPGGIPTIPPGKPGGIPHLIPGGIKEALPPGTTGRISTFPPRITYATVSAGLYEF